MCMYVYTYSVLMCRITNKSTFRRAMFPTCNHLAKSLLYSEIQCFKDFTISKIVKLRFIILYERLNSSIECMCIYIYISRARVCVWICILIEYGYYACCL